MLQKQRHEHCWQGICQSGKDSKYIFLMRTDEYCPICNRVRTRYALCAPIISIIRYRIRHLFHKDELPF